MCTGTLIYQRDRPEQAKFLPEGSCSQEGLQIALSVFVAKLLLGIAWK
jgi:hypothetical protein